MSFYPHNFLLRPSPLHSILISGPHIQLIETSTGNILTTTAQSEQTTTQDSQQSEAKKKKEKGTAQPPIPFVRCATLGGPDGTSKYLATAGDDKVLRVWNIEDLTLVNQRELPKRPTDVRFTQDGERIIVGDKFGDVFSYTLNYEPPTESSEPAQKSRDSIVSHENPSNGTLILGHTSLLTTFILSQDERYIITADRDEHLRVSWFPQGYAIETFCLGHQKYVTAIHNPTFSPVHLISGGGDTFLCIWDWHSGRLLHKIDGIRQAVEPHIQIQSRKRKNWDGRDDEGECNIKGRRKGKGKNRTRAKKNTDKRIDEAEESQDAEVGENGRLAQELNTPAVGQETSEEAEKKVLMINKITTVIAKDSQRYIIFSAVGTKAIFSVPLPNLNAIGSSISSPIICAFDLGSPVVDFSLTEDDHIWALLDGNCTSEGIPDPGSKKWAAVLTVGSNGELKEVPLSNELLTALNSKCLITASPDSLQMLDLYADMTSLPKWSSPDGSSELLEEMDVSTPLDTPTPNFASPAEVGMVGEGEKGTTSMSKRLLGRQRKKDAVKERLQQHGSSGTPRAETPVDEPEHKRARTTEDERTDQKEADIIMQDS